jgi:ketosteroid isomerase-like protein
MTAEADVRTVITEWVAAVAGQDLDGATAHHTDDIVMFDVPPPYDGVRGTTAYRDSWGPFFDWQRGGAVFELVELHVAAGDEVAYGYGLLRCGTAQDFAHNPDNRLRLTMGLRKVDGQWVIAHEHHSFPMTD